MARCKETMRDWRRFWGEVLKMWAKDHGLTVGLLWRLSPILTVLGVIGVFSLPEPWRTIGLVLLIIGGADLVISLCVIFPYQKYARDRKLQQSEIDRRNPAFEIQMAQEKNPSQFLAITPKEINVSWHEKDRKILSLHAGVSSVLFKPITITKIEGQFSVPFDQIHNPMIQFQSRPTETKHIAELATGIAYRTTEVILDCRDNPYIPGDFNIEHTVRLVQGSAIISTNEFPDVRIDFNGYITFKTLRPLR